MIGEYRFFQEFFDGQIVKDETDNFKMFKILLFSAMSALGLFFVFAEICNVAEFILLELGMIWNIYSGLNKRMSLALGVVVGLLYFFFASNFNIYANGLVYIAVYIPFQLIAISKDYSEGSFVQIRKKITDYNKLLFFIFMLVLCAAFVLFGSAMGARFFVLDAISATLLVCSAILRNERYNEYYFFRIAALCSSIALWIMIAVEYGSTGALAIILMYVSYLAFDIASLIFQTTTYKNQYMLELEKYKNEEDTKLVDEKLKVYTKSKTKTGTK